MNNRQARIKRLKAAFQKAEALTYEEIDEIVERKNCV